MILLVRVLRLLQVVRLLLNGLALDASATLITSPALSALFLPLTLVLLHSKLLVVMLSLHGL